METINGQNISTTIYNILGQKVWSSKKLYADSEINDFVWNGINGRGKKVSSGLYFIEIAGEKKTFKHKIIFLKND